MDNAITDVGIDTDGREAMAGFGRIKKKGASGTYSQRPRHPVKESNQLPLTIVQ
jgi:hypothetical protein